MKITRLRLAQFQYLGFLADRVVQQCAFWMAILIHNPTSRRLGGWDPTSLLATRTQQSKLTRRTQDEIDDKNEIYEVLV
jgi:hypothetical protein